MTKFVVSQPSLGVLIAITHDLGIWGSPGTTTPLEFDTRFDAIAAMAKVLRALENFEVHEVPDESDVESDVYPTKLELQRIKTWPPEDFDGLMNFVETLWWPGSRYVQRRLDNVVELSTSGWSGNEDIIEAIEANRIWWLLYWESSRRGGHYVFKGRGGKL